jgi:hypothetical protein
LFLTLTGFPKIGGGELHIAHLLWGGLGLIIATLSLLILVNRWVYVIGAVAGGIGIGLFIDEVGKFITQTNDYFYPLAIPIIYSVFLVTLLIYVEVRRPYTRDPRAEMYRALEMLQELLDRDLDQRERDALEERFQHITDEADNADLRALASALNGFLRADNLQLAPIRPESPFQKLTRTLYAARDSLVRRPRFLIGMVGALFIAGLISLIEPVTVIVRAVSPGTVFDIRTQLIDSGLVPSANGLTWYYGQLGGEAVIGLLLITAAALIATGNTRRGLTIGYLGLLFSLTIVNLLVFYYDQFGNLALTLIEGAMLLLLLRYRQLFMVPGAGSHPAGSAKKA